MTPTELAELHPKLFHVTAPDAWPKINRHGLLPPAELVHLFGVPEAKQLEFLRHRRASEVLLSHPVHGTATLSDNLPLSDEALVRCLDDGLTPADWYEMLNARVFFWTSLDRLDRLRRSKVNRDRPRTVLEFDTLTLATAHADRIAISPINSGAARRRPARRGRSTYADLTTTIYPDWRRQRQLSSADRIVEVVVLGGVPDIANYLVSAAVSP